MHCVKYYIWIKRISTKEMPNGLSNVTKLESSRFVAVNLLTFPLRCKSFRFIKGRVNGDLTGDSIIFFYIFHHPRSSLIFHSIRQNRFVLVKEKEVKYEARWCIKENNNLRELRDPYSRVLLKKLSALLMLALIWSWLFCTFYSCLSTFNDVWHTRHPALSCYEKIVQSSF